MAAGRDARAGSDTGYCCLRCVRSPCVLGVSSWVWTFVDLSLRKGRRFRDEQLPGVDADLVRGDVDAARDLDRALGGLYIYTYKQIYVHIYIYMCISISISIYIYIYINMLYLSLSLCMCMYVCIYIYIYIFKPNFELDRVRLIQP